MILRAAVSRRAGRSVALIMSYAAYQISAEDPDQLMQLGFLSEFSTKVQRRIA